VAFPSLVNLLLGVEARSGFDVEPAKRFPVWRQDTRSLGMLSPAVDDLPMHRQVANGEPRHARDLEKSAAIKTSTITRALADVNTTSRLSGDLATRPKVVGLVLCLVLTPDA
jgi:hypothetical protein